MTAISPPKNAMATPSHLLVLDLETRPDTAILPTDRDPSAFPKPIQHEIQDFRLPSSPRRRQGR